MTVGFQMGSFFVWRLSKEQVPHCFSLVRGHGCHIGQASDTVVTFEGGYHGAGVRVRDKEDWPRARPFQSHFQSSDIVGQRSHWNLGSDNLDARLE